MIKGFVHLKVPFFLFFPITSKSSNILHFGLTKKKSAVRLLGALDIMKLAANMKTINVSDCALVDCLSFCLCHSFSFPFHLSCLAPAFCEGDSMVSQLGLSNRSLISVELTAPFLAAAAKAHIHSHTPHLGLTLFSVKDQHSHRYLTYHLLASSHCSAFFFFREALAAYFMCKGCWNPPA